MPRPPLLLGTHGEIRYYRLPSGKVRARTKYRDYDGVVREVERVAASRPKADRKLKEALRDRARAVAGDEITPSSKIEDAAVIWLRELDESSKALRTKRTYHRSWERDLKPAVGSLRVSEMTVSLATRVLHTIRDSAGLGSAKHAKVVLCGILAVAMRFDAVESNAASEVILGQSKTKTKKQTERVNLTNQDYYELRKYLRDSDSAATYHRRDLPDLVDMLAALGCRIGELLALDWSKIDFAAGTVAIEGTVIRESGHGAFVQQHTKSRAGMRTVRAPRWAIELLARRKANSQSSWVFPTTAGTLRDPDNTRADLRRAVAGTRWEGLHPHAFRHLVATQLDEAGLTAREIADYLGHEHVSMTQDVYMNRKSVGDAAASALDALATGE